MDPEEPSATRETSYDSRPSSVSTHIAVEMGSTPEEDLYAAVEAMRTARSRSTCSAQPSDSGGEGVPFTFDSDMTKYPPSMTSSVRDHVYEGGLRYHAYRAGRYAFPNDDVEQNRDDMKHSMTLMLCQGAYFYAPVEPVLEAGAEVLDLGTGTGIWVIELGDKYPKTRFTGIDLSPIQPNMVPENVHFFVDDFEEDWVDPENKYDFIHIRHTLHSVRDLRTLLKRVMRHLKPGGYFEVQELYISPKCDDGSLTPETPYALRDYINYMVAGMRMYGSDLHAILSLPDAMKEAGFEDIQKTTHKCPIGVWPRDKRLRVCGLFCRTVVMDGLRGLSRRPLTALGWTQLQIEMFLVEVRKSVMEKSVHTYFPLHVVRGRKPLR
ncbi:Phosphoethanolamine N-methyltransferase 1 [Madurella mycetomatis]|uniref:Phosphoethanolamine N-methyltransferase 1 n=1 Tax=Madurella mycetomatis TaxID=100816 RepID=A0A175W3U4_9PEZI|nr:Phosphoethanolamine N-methyltransferase 1 [Madurella mycetomatis]KXX78232.1 Phosphoethanolamine N-methyltransferase 1 [Madurella mycetomatis]